MSSREFQEYADGFMENLKKLGDLFVDGMVEVTIPSGRMWRGPSNKFDLALNDEGSVWFVVPHHFHAMTLEELLRMYAAGDRRVVFNLMLLAGGAVVPRGLAWAADMERLVKADPRDEEIKRLREIISRNKAKYLQIQGEARALRSEVMRLREHLGRHAPARADVIEAGEA